MNNYKTTSLFRGVTPKSDDPTSYDIMMSNLTDGVEKKDLPVFFDVAVSASLGRAIDTRKGGYATKIFNAAFASLMLDVPDSDCGSKLTTTVEFSKDNMNEFIDRYIKEGSKLVLIDRETAPKYFGKTVQMRSPMYCKSQKICNKCAGEFYYKLKVQNIGLLANTISSMLLNASLKAFHDMSLKPVKPDFSKYISEE